MCKRTSRSHSPKLKVVVKMALLVYEGLSRVRSMPYSSASSSRSSLFYGSNENGSVCVESPFCFFKPKDATTSTIVFLSTTSTHSKKKSRPMQGIFRASTRQKSGGLRPRRP